ncbi:hypothetical protein [Roseococcus sp.]|uniref:hypothetical protein n=1 Tax=Roseococcus sp. TaxID=2109646 RepID=UPI003BAB58F1
MKRFVVDTNVPIVANGRADGAGGGSPSVDCRQASIEFLTRLLSDGRVLLDLNGEIQAEYHRHLHPKGQPGVGDRFYLAVLQSAPERVERLELPKAADGSFEDFPVDAALASFDLSDRKFAALARRAKVPVGVATDSDWVHAGAALRKNGVKIKFLCGCAPGIWFQT